MLIFSDFELATSVSPGEGTIAAFLEKYCSWVGGFLNVDLLMSGSCYGVGVVKEGKPMFHRER